MLINSLAINCAILRQNRRYYSDQVMNLITSSDRQKISFNPNYQQLFLLTWRWMEYDITHRHIEPLSNRVSLNIIRVKDLIN